MDTEREDSAQSSRQTLESVARVAGVSRQTVSNALNSPELLAPQTRDRVLATVAELGYRPSRAARALRTRRSNTLGLKIAPAGNGISGWLLDQFLHALVERAQGEGYHILLFTGGSDELEAYADLLEGSDLDGMVLTDTHHDDPRPAWLADRGVPFSVFGRPWGTDWESGPTHAWVDVDSAIGVGAAVRHLVSRGHERIGFVGWPRGSGIGDDRRNGWATALDVTVPGGSALARSRGWDVEVLDGVELGRSAATELLAATEAPTAVVCASDSLALGVSLATDATGSRLAVVGYDDTPVAAALGLTSVAQPIAEAARACIDLVLAQLSPDDASNGPQSLLLAPRLVVRSSS